MLIELVDVYGVQYHFKWPSDISGEGNSYFWRLLLVPHAELIVLYILSHLTLWPFKKNSFLEV